MKITPNSPGQSPHSPLKLPVGVFQSYPSWRAANALSGNHGCYFSPKNKKVSAGVPYQIRGRIFGCASHVWSCFNPNESFINVLDSEICVTCRKNTKHCFFGSPVFQNPQITKIIRPMSQLVGFATMVASKFWPRQKLVWCLMDQEGTLPTIKVIQHLMVCWPLLSLLNLHSSRFCGESKPQKGRESTCLTAIHP